MWTDNSANPLPFESPSTSSLFQSPDPSQLTELRGSNSSNPQTIAFVDASVADAMTVMANLRSDVKILLDPTRDGIGQITTALSHYQNLTGIEIISHGNTAQVQLGANSLNANSLTQYARELQQWNTSLAPEADILFYGCNVAAGAAGQDFLRNLSTLTGADIAASTNLTGNASKGGDWQLEYTTGKIETQTPVTDTLISTYQGVLQSVFSTQTPTTLNQTDGTGSAGDYELGMEFTSAKAGQINAIRYYKGDSETGNHVGRIWSNTGTLLGSVNFTNETASGWQQQALTTAVNIEANTTYVVSVNANTHFALTGDGFDTTITNGDLSAVADGTNGVFNGTPGDFPIVSYNKSNYFRDVVFTPNNQPPTNQLGTIAINGTPTQNQILRANVADADGLTGVTVNYKWQQSSDTGTTWSDIVGATNQTLILGQAQVNQQVRATATYTDALGSSENVFSTGTGTITANTTRQSVFTTQTPDNINQMDGLGSDGDYELGMEFTSAKAGEINAIRYYRSPTETGNHVGNIWSNTGTLLGSVNFTNETASGWQEQVLSTPLSIAANTTYVVSVNTNSHFAVTGNGISTTITNGDLSAVADGSNGIFSHTPGAFPIFSNNNNYFQDIVFTPTSVTPTNQPGTIAVSGTPTQNQILTANVADVDGLTGVTVNYKWQQSSDTGTTWNDIAGATSQTLTLGQAQVNNLVRATATYTDALGTSENPLSTATAAVVNVNDLGSIAVSGTPTQNQILTANVADVDGLTGVTVNYKWQQSSDTGTTWTDIVGATSQTLTLGQAQVNKQVRATATYTDALGGSENVLSLGTGNITGSVILQSIFTTQTPDNINQTDGTGSAGDYELGMEFTSVKAGQINAIRYYKAASETGSHTGTIWSSTGTLLGSVNFTNETASGWQQQTLSTPLNIAANTTYIVSVNANSHFAVSANGISTTITNGDLSAVADGSNGVFDGNPGVFPTFSNNNNYFRDIVFAPNSPPPNNQLGTIAISGTATQNQILTANVADADGLTGVTINYKWQQSGNNGTTWTDIAGATSQTLTLGQAQVNNQVRATATYTDVLGSSENTLSTATAAVVNVNDPGSVTIGGMTIPGSVLTANVADVDGLTGVTINYKWQQSGDNGTTWTDIAGATNQTLTLGQAQVNTRVRATATYTDALGGSENVLSAGTGTISSSTIMESVFSTQIPDNPNQTDGTGSAGDYELGMEFTSTKAGQINAIRYYKATSETGSHTGTIWSSTGTLLGSVNFTSETGSGWQQQLLNTPLNIAANTTYVVSVNANSHFAVSGNGIGTTITNGSLSAVADGSNGVFNATPGAFPTFSTSNNNYFRDVVFTPDSLPNNNQAGKVILKGSATVGRSLTETVLDADGLTGAINYDWQQSGDNGNTWASITGATTKSLTLTNDWLGKQVRVRTTYTDALGNNENVVSAGTTIAAQNAIVLENQKTGTTDWQINTTLATNNEIAGYGDATSINKGQALNLKVSLATAGQYGIDVYRLGYYGGAGGRLISSVSGLNGVTQAAPTVDPTTRMVECKWDTSYTLQTGTDWTSGLYLAKLTDSVTGKQSYVEFVLRDDGRPTELGFQEAVTTNQAYNNYGGYSSYTFNSINNQAAHKISFDRPLSVTAPSTLTWEYNMARWVESQGYDVSYYSNLDVQTNPLQLYSQNTFLSVGHDEYWSMEMRDNVEKARDNGTNLGFFSANSAYWRVRFENSSTGASNRVMAIYKDSWNLDPVAQLDNSKATNRFRSTQVNRPENALLGVMYTGLTNDSTGGFNFVVSNAADPYYAGTGLNNGDSIPGLVGYEWDAVVNNGLTPSGLVVLSQSPVVPDSIDPSLPAGTNTNISNAVRYTAASGAKVFSTGTIQWAWGLDSDRAPNPRVSPLAQKITTNVLADMGAQAQTPQVLAASTSQSAPAVMPILTNRPA